jgi:hypothetical protein
MYFRPFQKDIQSSVPSDILFTVESLICQMLATADLEYLDTALQQKRLAHAFFEELDFFGQVPKDCMPDVKAYLEQQEAALGQVVRCMIKDPHNESLRERLCQTSGTH